MKTAQATIEILRERLQAARSENAGAEVMVFMELLSHPDAQWSDVISALSRWMLRETAALQFYLHFQISRPGVAIEMDPRVWKEYLSTHDVRLSDKIGDATVKH